MTGGKLVGGFEQTMELALTQLEVTVFALMLSLVLALPFGLWLGHKGVGELVAIGVGNAGRAIPELVLIAFMAAAIGVGVLNLTIALAVLGIPPILTNSFIGIRQVDRAPVDAARGIGMSELEVLLKVELPLAIPTVMAGVRLATIAIVSTATIAPLAGVLTLGDYIINENVYGENGVVAGAIVVAVMALGLELLLALLQRRLTSPGSSQVSPELMRANHKRGEAMRTRTTRLGALAAMLTALVLSLGVAACGSSSDTTGESTSAETAEGGAIVSNPANGKVSLTIGSKNFPEQEILGEIYTQALAAAGYKTKSDLNLGSETVALKTLKSGQISGYPEYASTALTSFFGLEPEEVSSNADEAYEKAKAEFEKEGLTAFPPTPFASANAVGTLKKTAEELGLKTISDLEGQSEKLTLYGSPECRQRIDCLAGLEKYYGLKFKSFKPVDIGLRYTVLEKGQADLSILFTTDPQLSAESDKFVILEDDKEVFPAGNVIFVTSEKVAEEAGPDYEKTIVAGPEGPDAAGHAGARRTGRTRKEDGEGSGR